MTSTRERPLREIVDDLVERALYARLKSILDNCPDSFLYRVWPDSGPSGGDWTPPESGWGFHLCITEWDGHPDRPHIHRWFDLSQEIIDTLDADRRGGDPRAPIAPSRQGFERLCVLAARMADSLRLLVGELERAQIGDYEED